MTWIPLLLIDPSPCLRYLILKELLNRPKEDPEVIELLKLRVQDPLVKELIKLQKPNGSWDSFSISRIESKNSVHITSVVLQRLGFLGFDSSFIPIRKAAEFMFTKQLDDGSWQMPRRDILVDEENSYQMMPVQTAIPLLGLLMTGYSTDKRVERAFDWLLEQKLDDGAWPVGISAGIYGGIAGYRHLVHSKFGCRSNTTTVLSCFAYHPKLRSSNEAKRALDLILGTNIKLRNTLGFTIARLLGLEKSFGWITFMAKFDIAHLLNLCWRVGASINDERIADFITFIRKEQGKFGLWENKRYPQASRWISFDLLRSLSNLDFNKEWISLEPKTPFQAYIKKKRRF